MACTQVSQLVMDVTTNATLTLQMTGGQTIQVALFLKKVTPRCTPTAERRGRPLCRSEGAPPRHRRGRAVPFGDAKGS